VKHEKAIVIFAILAIVCATLVLMQKLTEEVDGDDLVGSDHEHPALMTVTHDGHKWVIYGEWGYNSGRGGLAHHPDCECDSGIIPP